MMTCRTDILYRTDLIGYCFLVTFTFTAMKYWYCNGFLCRSFSKYRLVYTGGYICINVFVFSITMSKQMEKSKTYSLKVVQSGKIKNVTGSLRFYKVFM